MQGYRIEVKQLADELTDHEDKLVNPSGVYFRIAETEDEALDDFHSSIAIGCLEDFEITIDEQTESDDEIIMVEEDKPSKIYKVWIEVEEYDPKIDEYTKGLQLDAGEFETETEANQYASKLFEGN